MILTPFARRTIITLSAAVVLCLLGFTLSTCLHGVQLGKRDAVVAKTTGKALDRVASTVPIIRNEQKAKEHEVEQIPGASDRLPDGFAAELERVRSKRN